MDLTPQVLKDVEFREKFRGYDPDEVDAFLEQVGAAIGQLQARLKAALDQQGAPAPQQGGRLHDPEGALQRVLVAAQETADKVIHEAEIEASSMVRDAERKSSTMVTEAEEHSEKVRSAAAAEARKALEEARQPLLAEIADLRSEREQLQHEVSSLERFLDSGKADALASLERVQAALADPSALTLGESPVPESAGDLADESDGEPGGATASAPAPALPPPVVAPAADAAPEPAPPSTPTAPAEFEAPAFAPEPASAPEPDEPSPPRGEADPDVVVDLTVNEERAMAAAREEGAVWAQGGEVIHGAFASSTSEERLDLVDPDGGPPTEAYMNLFDEGSGETGDRFLDELRRAVDDDDDALGRPDEEADAAMAAFFDQDEDDSRFGRG